MRLFASLFASVVLLVVTVTAGMVRADEPLTLDDDMARGSYSLGYQLGSNFKRQALEIDTQAMMAGIEDALSGTESRMPEEARKAAMTQLRERVSAERKRRALEQQQQRLAAGKEFLEENAKRDGVVTTASGLQFRIVQEGTGRTPGPDDRITVHYRGTLIDGEEFDSSYKRGKPATLKVDGVIEGWSEGLQRMQEGGRSELFIPPELAYGERGRLANQTLVFEVELISVDDPKEGEPLGPEGVNNTAD